MTKEPRFDPQELKVKAGDTVTCINGSLMPHTATSEPEQNPINPAYGKLQEGADPRGYELHQPAERYSQVFDIPGNYDYICIPHVLSGMRGRIVVEW